MTIAVLAGNSLRRLYVVAPPTSSGTRDRLILAARALALMAGCHLFISTTAADECRSCELSRAVPPGLWREFSESLDALDRFTLADEALAQRLGAIAGMRPVAGDSVIGDANLQRFIYPWKPELLQDGGNQDAHDTVDQEPEAADDTPPQPTWLHVPDPSDDGDDRRLTVSAAEARHEPALATALQESEPEPRAQIRH